MEQFTMVSQPLWFVGNHYGFQAEQITNKLVCTHQAKRFSTALAHYIA